MHFSVILQLLDFPLGHGHVAHFQRVELETVVNLHGNEVCSFDREYSVVPIVFSS